MSKMSQLDMELTEEAAKLGFSSYKEAEENGYAIQYETGKLIKVEDQINEAYKDLEEEQEANKEAKQLEMVYNAISYAKDMIAMVYKPDDKPYASPMTDITDEKIRDYYYELNSMCVDLAERNVMIWQKEK